MRKEVICPKCELEFLSAREKTICPGCKQIIEPRVLVTA
jgi:hypothetical protein